MDQNPCKELGVVVQDAHSSAGEAQTLEACWLPRQLKTANSMFSVESYLKKR